MKFIALVSGGKDSFFNIHHCLTQGHELVAIGNLYPKKLEDEIDSFMFQTVGHDIISYYSLCLDVPLYRQAIEGGSKNQDLEYSKTENDEIEDLYQLIDTILKAHPEVEAVSCGAILSHYQRTRVENICDRFGLISLTFLWQRDQDQLMQEMCQSELDARIIKVAAIGLLDNHLGKSITQLYPQLVKLNQLYDVHICGEGGEFETIVLDCKFFKHQKLSIVDQHVVHHSSDVSFLKFKVELIEKDPLGSFEAAAVPELLEEPFDELVTEKLPVEDFHIESLGDLSEYSVDKYISEVNNNLYISNLTDNTASDLTGQTANIFDNLHKILKEHDLTFDDIQHVTLLLSDMNKFAEINDIYKENFKNYLPPSRICIETNISTLVQLSCKCIIKEFNTKKGIHIRSRSYWAPPNIGPYSQARVEEQFNYNYATVSGQIPLVPATMDLITDEDKAMSLTLQHFHRIKTLINVPDIVSIICFITNKINLNGFIDMWKNYCDLKESSATFKKLIILEVNELPRKAIIEIGGDTVRSISDPYEDSDSEEEMEGLLNVITQLQAKFPDLSVTEVNNSKSVILFTNSVETMDYLFGLITKHKHHIKIYSNIKDFVNISHHNFEYLPVKNVFNSELQQFNYGVCLSITI